MNRIVSLFCPLTLGLLLLAAGCPPPASQQQAQQPQQPPPQFGANQPQQGYPPPGYPPPQQQPQQAPPQGQPQPFPQAQPQQPGFPPPSFPQAQPGQPPPQPAPGQPAPAPTAQPASTAPGGFPFPFPQIPGLPAPGAAPAPGGGSSGASATPIDPNVALAATIPLTALAAQEAQGMQREGGITAGQFQEGQTLEATVQLTPNKCYTVLAVGVGIQEMDITLVVNTPIPGQSPVLARDTGSGSQASLGGKGNCFKWQFPVATQGRYILKASKGGGIAAGQLFVK